MVGIKAFFIIDFGPSRNVLRNRNVLKVSLNLTSGKGLFFKMAAGSFRPI